MKAFRRFLLLATFATFGVAAAIFVGISSDPSLRARLYTAISTPAKTRWEIVTDEAPRLVKSHPHVASQYPDPEPEVRNKKTSAAPAGTGPSIIPAAGDVTKAKAERAVPGTLLAQVDRELLAQVSGSPDAAMQYVRDRMTAPVALPPPVPPPGPTQTPAPPAPGPLAAKPEDLLLEAPAPPTLGGVKAAMPAAPSAPLAPAEVVPAPAPLPSRARTATAPARPVPSAAAETAPKPPRPIVKTSGNGDGKLTIHIQNADLREVLDMMSEQGGLNILAGKEVQGKVSATLNSVDIQTAVDAILKSTGYTSRRQGKFLFVGTPEEFNTMEQAMDRVGTRVYRPNYIAAAELKILVQPLMTEKIGMVSVSTPAEVGIAASDAAAGGDKFAGGDVVLVRDYEAVLTQVDQVVAEIDVRPMQVCIEAMILSVKLNDTDKFGVDFSLLTDHVKFGWGTPAATLGDVKLDGGLKFGYLNSNVGVFVNALEQIADTRIIGKPRLMVLNKHRAEILIGNKKGYVSTTVTETSSTQSVDFLETGVQLRLRPFISRDGLVRMEVHPEISQGDVIVTGNFTLPNKELTEVTTNVMVRDGCTMILGGLIKEQLTNSVAAVPVLGSLPWVGALFRDTTQVTEREELIVLITPRIVYEPETCQEGSKAACEFHRAHDSYVDAAMSPLSRRAIGRRYFRLAQSAWSEGRSDAAWRFIELAIHFDPMNKELVDFRAQLCQAGAGGERVAEGAAKETPTRAAPSDAAGHDLPGETPQIEPWMIDDLPRQGPAVPMHPYDPGQPGLHKDIQRPRNLQ